MGMGTRNMVSDTNFLKEAIELFKLTPQSVCLESFSYPMLCSILRILLTKEAINLQKMTWGACW
jgi:hypothetical protein